MTDLQIKAKEKAEELFLKYINHTKKWDSENGWQDDKSDAQECAIIAVNEILKAGKDVEEFADSFWQEVLTQIEQL